MSRHILISFLAIFLFCSCSIIRPKTTDELKLSPDIMSHFPNSSPKDFIRCDKVLRLEKLYQKAYECASKEHKEVLTVNKDELPLCVIVSRKSKDIMTDKKGTNYLEVIDVGLTVSPEGITVQVMRSPAVGLFIGKENTMLLIENPDLDRIYSHELYHWFLAKSNLPDENHDDVFWKKCAPATYKPNSLAKIANWFHRLVDLF